MAEQGRGCLCCRKFGSPAGRRGAGIHTPTQIEFTADNSVLPCFHIQYRHGTLRSRAMSSYLCGTASDLNLVAHWFGFSNRDEGWDLLLTPTVFQRKRNLQGHVTQKPLDHQLTTCPWVQYPGSLLPAWYRPVTSYNSAQVIWPWRGGPRTDTRSTWLTAFST